MSARYWLSLALLALAVLYAAWFGSTDDYAGAVFFALPPLLLAAGNLWRPRAVAFWSGVLALGWFSHGIMLAWSRPEQGGFALAAVALALAVIVAANFDGLQARFGRKHR